MKYSIRREVNTVRLVNGKKVLFCNSNYIDLSNYLHVIVIIKTSYIIHYIKSVRFFCNIITKTKY